MVVIFVELIVYLLMLTFIIIFPKMSIIFDIFSNKFNEPTSEFSTYALYGVVKLSYTKWNYVATVPFVLNIDTAC